MGLLGTLFGGTVGFMLGGPLGMIIGGAIGSQSGATSRGGPRATHGARLGSTGAFQNTQTTFLVTLISLAAKVAKADGHVTREEVQAFDVFLRDNLRMAAGDRRMAARIFNEARDSAIPRLAAGPPGPRHPRTLPRPPARPGDPAAADRPRRRATASRRGKADPRDRRQPGPERPRLPGMPRPSSAPPDPTAGSSYEILGVSSDVSDQEIKKAYRKIAREYHPDVLQSKGLPEDFMQFAKEKLQKVNEAYDVIKTERGF